jgi:type I restriction enzyme, S subunit
VGTVYEHADVIYGAPFASGKFNTDGRGLPLIRIRDLSDHNPEIFTDEEHPKGTRIRAGDIVVGMDGEFRAHVWRGPECWLNQRMCQFKPKRVEDAAFVLYAIEPLLAEVERSEVGTTVIHLGKADMDKFKVVVPPRAVMDAFAKIARPMLDQMVANGIESRRLAATRDALLPVLLSGEVRLRSTGTSTPPDRAARPGAGTVHAGAKGRA